MRRGLGRAPKDSGPGQDIRRCRDRLRTIKIEVGQAARRLAEDNADVLLGPVEVSGRGLGVDPDILPSVDERALLAVRDGNRRPASCDVVERCGQNDRGAFARSRSYAKPLRRWGRCVDAFVAVVTSRNQLEEEFVTEVGVGQVMDLGRRPRTAALITPSSRLSASARLFRQASDTR